MSANSKINTLTTESITTLVHTFYAKVRKDEMLAPIFNEVIKDDWDNHLKTLCLFWETILLHTGRYSADPMSKHLPLPLTKEHFVRWLHLFEQTTDELFSSQLSDEIKKRANSIALIMQMKKGISFGKKTE